MICFSSMLAYFIARMKLQRKLLFILVVYIYLRSVYLIIHQRWVKLKYINWYYYRLKQYTERTAIFNICNYSLLKSLRSACSSQISFDQEIIQANKQQRKEINYQWKTYQKKLVEFKLTFWKQNTASITVFVNLKNPHILAPIALDCVDLYRVMLDIV